MRAFLFTVGAVFFLNASSAARAEWLLAAFATRIAAGEPLKISVVRDVEGTGAPLPDRLEVVIEAGERRIRADFVAAARADRGAFRRDYVMTWPADVTGPVVLQLAEGGSSRLMLVAQEAAPPPGKDALAPPVAAAPAPLAAAPEPALSVNEPMYFLLGLGGDLSARFQLSFKYRIFDPESHVVELLPALRGLHFGYTQTALWDLGADSKPFRDTSYRPSLFYEWRIPAPAQSPHLISARAGYEHESNGRDHESSRSIDTLFASLDWRYSRDDGHSYVGLTPKLWAYLDRGENPDIYRYRGYGELGVRFGRDDGWLARLRLRRAMGGVGSTQLDLSYPLTRRILSETAAYLHLQVFDGVGETLLDYNRSHGTQFRIGFSIQR
jgi:hypothetical protein